MWAYIKKVLNSTVGTKELTPLDVLINNQKTLYASDELYANIADKVEIKLTEAQTYTYNYPCVIKPYNSGSFKVSCLVEFLVSAYAHLTFKIYNNGEEVYSETKNRNDENTYFEYITYFNPKDKLTFSFEFDYDGGGGSATLNLGELQIKGTITENVLNVEVE